MRPALDDKSFPVHRVGKKEASGEVRIFLIIFFID